jgi:hypothetical protein
LKISQHKNCMIPRWLVQVLHPPQEFETPPFWNSSNYWIKKHNFEATFNDMTSLLNFIKSSNWFKTYYGGHRHSGDAISLAFLFKESGLIITYPYFRRKNFSQ